jgi:hypothetical protein
MIGEIQHRSDRPGAVELLDLRVAVRQPAGLGAHRTPVAVVGLDDRR